MFNLKFYETPFVIVSASHSTLQGNTPAEFNSISTWIEVSYKTMRSHGNQHQCSLVLLINHLLSAVELVEFNTKS